jgi:hypothetical protein
MLLSSFTGFRSSPGEAKLAEPGKSGANSKSSFVGRVKSFSYQHGEVQMNITLTM